MQTAGVDPGGSLGSIKLELSDISVLYEINLPIGCTHHTPYSIFGLKLLCIYLNMHNFGVILIKHPIASGGLCPCFRDHLYIQTPLSENTGSAFGLYIQLNSIQPSDSNDI